MSKPAPLSVSVTAFIPTDAITLYDSISDISRMPEFSPENVLTEWLDGASGPAVGVRFKGTNRLGSNKWSTKPTIIAADRGRRFAFKVPGGSGPEWTYTFEPVEGGTRVTESMSQAKASPMPIRFLQRRAGVTDRAAHLREGMTTTLDRLAASTAGAARPSSSDDHATTSI